MATDGATWVAQNFPSGSGRALTSFGEPCPRGLLEFQNSEAIFYVRPVQAKRTFFLSSGFWQGCLWLH